MTSLPIVPVAVEAPQHSGVGDLLSYTSEQPLLPGTLVRVPLGRRQVAGVVWHRAAAAVDGTRLRPVAGIVECLPPLDPRWRALVDFCAAYYQRGVGEVAMAVLPPLLRDADDDDMQRRLKRWGRAKSSAAASASEQPLTPEPPPELSDAQRDALAQIATAGQATTLLHGVTGSGKTEVYLRLIGDLLERGAQALVLVPEINLTPQLEQRFARRFPARRIVSLHSGLTPGQRLHGWWQAMVGEADIVLGTRLAIFTPLPRLALVVVDEEHDPSFKQQDGARYSARDLAVWRGAHEGVPVLLGSATPSLETWHHARRGRYRLTALTERVGAAAMPRVRLLDMARVPKSGSQTPLLAPPLLQAIEQRLARGEQSLLLLNRRGYAPVLYCAACGWKSGCPHCSAWRVFHKSDRTLRCHHCGVAERVPRGCPDCGNLDLAPIGRGTEKLEEQLAAVHAGEVDVLVGTQMVTKGHDFRRMTLVAAVNPDGALFSSDFRAPERLFAMLMQAGGRAGRDADAASASEMWVQTWHPTHPLYSALVAHDFERFAAIQLEERRVSSLPPYSHLALLRADAASAEVAAAFLNEAAQAAAALAEAAPVTIYPVVPLPVQRVAGIERQQMLVESASRAALQRFLAVWLPALHGVRARHRKLERWAIDVDPLAV